MVRSTVVVEGATTEGTVAVVVVVVVGAGSSRFTEIQPTQSVERAAAIAIMMENDR